jgi:AAA domain
MALIKATKQKAKIRLGLSAVSGGGKTYSAILIGKGLCGDLSKVAIIDTENGSGHLYADLGDYSVLQMTAPFSPEKYIAAIKECEAAGMKVIIIDSITHCWNFILEEHSKMQGNSFANWSKFKPRTAALRQAINNSTAHTIETVRRKQDYELGEQNGKKVPTKVGLKEVTEDGWEYELTLCFQLGIDHYAVASKDRSGVFMGKPDFVPNVETGKQIKDWCESGIEPLPQLLPPPDQETVLQQALDNTIDTTSPKFPAILEKVASGQVTVAEVQKHFPLTEAAKRELVQAYAAFKSKPAEPLKELLTDEHPEWPKILCDIAERKYALSTLEQRFEISKSAKIDLSAAMVKGAQPVAEVKKQDPVIQLKSIAPIGPKKILHIDHPQFEQIIQAIQTGKKDMFQLEEVFDITPEAAKYISLSLAMDGKESPDLLKSKIK